MGLCVMRCTKCRRTFWSFSYQKMCIECANKEAERWKSKSSEYDVDLESKFAFLRLQAFSEPPDDIQKREAVFVVQGRTDEPLRAHKFVLSSKSPVFRTMFDVKMSEKETGIICIDDATLPVIRAMIKFCYDAEIDFTDEVTADEVLAVAHKYQIDVLQTISERHLIKTLNESNLLKRLGLAKKFDARHLRAGATKYFKRKFDEVIDDVLTEIFC